MPTDFIPSRESELVTWSTTFKTLVSATPTAFNLTSAQATTYTSKHNAFVSAYQIANEMATRSPSNIIAKDDAKNALTAEARKLARIVQAAPSVTDEQKSDLGLTVRDTEPSPVPPPGSAPNIAIVSVVGCNVRIRLEDASSPTRRGKPAGVDGATVLSYVGATPPTNDSAWKFEGNTTRTSFDIAFSSELAPATKVWVTAFWYNPRAQRGPASNPVGVNVHGGAAMAA